MKKLSYILLCGLLLILSACEKDTESANFAPVITTGSASNIYRMGATLSGSIQLTETNTAQSYGILFSELESMAEYDEYPVKDGSRNYSVLVQDLEPGTTYYYCAYASSSYSIAKSQIKSFTTTESNAPVFNEVILQSKDEKSCVVSVELLDDGGSELLMTGFVWGEADNGAPTIKSNVANVEPQGNHMSATIKGMEPNKVYLVRAYGVNAQGVGYSNSVIVTTNTATVPFLSDITRVDSTEMSITVKASVLDTGLGEVSNYGFCYSSESKEPTTDHLVVETIEGDSKNFSALIEGLKPETTYYIRAYAVNERGTGYSETFVYTTKAPTVPGIYSSDDLAAFHDAIILGSDLSQWVNESKVINLYADIDATSFNWTPIYQLSADYIFDGNGHTITLKKTTVAEDDLGFAVFYNNMGTIQNLNVTMDMTLSSSGDGYTKPYATICTINNGVVQNCHSKISAELNYHAACFGGIAYVNNAGATISQCTSEGLISGGLIMGGIAAQNNGGTISDCINNVAIVDGGADTMGGIAGYNYSDGRILNCVNNGNFSSPSNRNSFGIGGIVGRLFNGMVDNCRNNGSIEVPLVNAVGGIAGNASEIMDYDNANNTTRIVTNCTNTGNIVGPDDVTGNMIGVLDGADSKMTGCTYGGTVNGAPGTETNAIGKDMRAKGDYSNGTVTLQEAGTLASLIPESEKYSITELKIVGPLNGDDIRYLREMAGRDVNGNETNGRLVDLDISEATIVAGGGAYYGTDVTGDSYYTTDNIIGANMFRGTILENFFFPKVTTIEKQALDSCVGLVKVNVPEGVTEIQNEAFAGCENLISAYLPETLVTIGLNAFAKCSSLHSIVIPNGVTKIANSTFRDCSALTSIILPDGVTEISNAAFYGCSSLTNITIPNGVTKISEHTFYGCTSLTHIILPDGVTEIGGLAFGACSSLTDINIPDGVTIIGNFSFLSCSSLKSITLPGGITSIGKDAFSSCSSLSEVISKATTPPSLGSSAFSRIASPSTLYVPSGCVNTYKATDWANYFSIIKAEGETESNDANINDIPTEEW